MSCKIRDKAQGPSAFMSKPSGQLACSTPELRAQLNLTNDHKKKEKPHLKHVLLPDHERKGDARYSGTLFNTQSTDRVKPEK